MAGAAAGAVAVGGALLSSDAAGSAANKQATSAQNATDAQTALAREQMANAKQLNAPFYGAGTQAVGQLQNILLGNAGGPTGTGSYDLTQIPGYQFGLNQGTEAIQNRAGAAGTQLSGNTLKDLQSYGQGYAGTAYNNYLSQLGGLSQMGQASANNQVATGNNALSNLASQTGSNLIGAGNAQAAGTVGQANAINNGLGQATNAYMQQQYLSGVFGSGSGGGSGTGRPTMGFDDPTQYGGNYA